MKNTQRKNKIILNRLIALLSLLLLSACLSSQRIQSNTDETLDKAQTYIDNARRSKGDVRIDWLLKASEILLQTRRSAQSLEILQQVQSSNPQGIYRERYHALMGESFSQADRHEVALGQFRRVLDPTMMTIPQQRNYHRAFGDSLYELNRFFESAQARMTELRLTSDILEQEAVREILWQTLMTLPNPQVFQNSLNSREVAGWLDLVTIAKQFASEPEALIRSLEIWKGRYTDHIAQTSLPLDLANAMSVKSYDPKTIAVLLPATGQLASAVEHIQRGILSAHYNNSNNQTDDVNLVFYDTNQQDILALYDQAVAEGAGFVIGPIQQDAVKALSSSENLTVPVLAINKLLTEDEDIFYPENFYQFGLPIEDEISSAAEHIKRRELKRGLLLIPNNAQGERAAAAFETHFNDDDFQIHRVVRYQNSEDYAKAVQTLLGVDTSLQRHRRLEQLAGVTMEFQARRRQDVDFIYFVADARSARRIKPFIDFYYAHDLTLFANANINQGELQPTLDNDLNKVIFADIPLLVEQQGNSQADFELLESVWPESSQGVTARLYALGYDSYNLIPDLSKLRYFPNYKIAGLSGNLSVSLDGQVHRELVWSQFQRGLPVVLPPLPELSETVSP